MNFLLFQNLQNYFQQNKFIVLDENLKKIKFDFNQFIAKLNQLFKEGYRCFYYTGNNPMEILSLLHFKLENKVEVILGDKAHDLSEYTYSQLESLYIKKEGLNKFFIFTSGTTGDPKKININLNNLFISIKTTKTEELTWLLTYNPKSFAGLQVLLTAFLSNNILLASSVPNSMNQLLKIIEKFSINAISATPTFWRVFINTNQVKKTKLSLITLGGEIVDKVILEKLINKFPGVKITQIYATTEFGKVFSVTDNKPGFPVEYLTKYDLKIKNSELLLKKNNKYISTKDFVEILDNRVMFVGRNTDFIKVAGNKVNLNKVEQIIIQLPNVIDAKIKTMPSTIVGNILVLDIVLGKDNTEKRSDFKKMLRNNLQTFEVPKMINFNDSVNTNSNLKKSK